MHQITTLPFLIAGLSLLGVVPGELLWFALVSAWVLLVEILR